MPLSWTPRVTDRPLRVLALGAHPDDIEIGCGGTFLAWLRDAVPLDVMWVVCGGSGDREAEARRSADYFLRRASRREVIVHGFRDGYFPYEGAGLKDEFERLKGSVEPDLIFTHYRDDRHQDHRVVSDLTWNTFRHHTILEYEVPKYDGDLGAPNVFVPFTREVAEAKAHALLAHFPSQTVKHWFTADTFLGLARLRGVEAASSAPYAEGFYVRKLRLDCSGVPSLAAVARGMEAGEDA
jgi:LmbE family N-acetylglucosaminyl deacetylase